MCDIFNCGSSFKYKKNHIPITTDVSLTFLFYDQSENVILSIPIKSTTIKLEEALVKAKYHLETPTDLTLNESTNNE